MENTITKYIVLKESVRAPWLGRFGAHPKMTPDLLHMWEDYETLLSTTDADRAEKLFKSVNNNALEYVCYESNHFTFKNVVGYFYCVVKEVYTEDDIGEEDPIESDIYNGLCTSYEGSKITVEGEPYIYKNGMWVWEVSADDWARKEVQKIRDNIAELHEQRTKAWDRHYGAYRCEYDTITKQINDLNHTLRNIRECYNID